MIKKDILANKQSQLYRALLVKKTPQMPRLRGIDRAPVSVRIVGLEFRQRMRSRVDRDAGVAVGDHLFDVAATGGLAASVNIHQARHLAHGITLRADASVARSQALLA